MKDKDAADEVLKPEKMDPAQRNLIKGRIDEAERRILREHNGFG